MGLFDALKWIGKKWGDVERGAASARLAMHGYTPEVIQAQRERLEYARFIEEQKAEREREAHEWRRAAEERAGEDQRSQRTTQAQAHAAKILDYYKSAAIRTDTGEYVRPDLPASYREGVDDTDLAGLWEMAKTQLAAGRLEAEEQRTRAADAETARDARERHQQIEGERRRAELGFDQFMREQAYRREHPAPDTEGLDPLWREARTLVNASDPMGMRFTRRGPDGKLMTDPKTGLPAFDREAYLAEVEATRQELRSRGALRGGGAAATGTRSDALGTHSPDAQAAAVAGLPPEQYARLDAETRAEFQALLAGGNAELIAQAAQRLKESLGAAR